MTKQIKNSILLVLAIIFILDIIKAVLSPKVPLFLYPSGNDKEIGRAIGFDTWRLMELVIVYYTFKQQKRKQNKQNKQYNNEKIKDTTEA